MSRRYEFDVPGASGSTASFRHTGKDKPWPSFALMMQTLACAAIAHMDIEARACDPRVGDRFIGLDGFTIVEVRAIIPMQDAGLGPGHELCIDCTHTTYPGNLIPFFLWRYQELARNAIQGGHTFHAAEDDEE